jgi:hypothetical protein
MDIDLLELRTITNRLLDHIIETRGVTRIELEQNYYWDMSEEALYSVSEKPREFDLGSLSDDWDFVSGLLDAETQPVAYQLTELAPILRYIGQSLGKRLAGEGG